MAYRECRGFQWKLRRSVDRVVAYVEHRTTRPYPKTDAALKSLLAALSVEMPLGRKRLASDSLGLSEKQRTRVFSEKQRNSDRAYKKQYDKGRRLQKEHDELRAKIAKHTVFKSGEHNQIVPDWLVTVFLSQPNPSARGMERAVRDVAAMDVPVISRKSMERIRDAWITMYKPMVLKIVADRLKAVVASAKHDARGVGCPWFVPVWFLLVQDEADLKLRSREDDGHDVLRRSRASKVQQSPQNSRHAWLLGHPDGAGGPRRQNRGHPGHQLRTFGAFHRVRGVACKLRRCLACNVG